MKKRFLATIRLIRQSTFTGSSDGAGGGVLVFVVGSTGAASFVAVGSLVAGGVSLTVFSIGGNGWLVSYSSPGSGRGLAVTLGGALFAGAAAPL